jgi:hypothetical protein
VKYNKCQVWVLDTNQEGRMAAVKPEPLSFQEPDEESVIVPEQTIVLDDKEFGKY